MFFGPDEVAWITELAKGVITLSQDREKTVTNSDLFADIRRVIWKVG